MNLDDVKGMMEDMGWHVPNLDDIDRSRNRFMSVRDTHVIPGNIRNRKAIFRDIILKQNQLLLKRKLNRRFQEREKSDAGKLADRFTELLKKQ